MLQRIQTIYLLLAALCFGSLFITSVSFGDFNQPVDSIPASKDGYLNIADHPAAFALTILGVICATVGIALFKNRPMQIRLAWLAVLLALGLAVFGGWLLYDIGKQVLLAGNINLNMSGIGFLPLVLAILFGFLAVRNIRKDELLVRSSDRLR
jgi:hypothetical protein